jgi:hypothetical protein
LKRFYTLVSYPETLPLSIDRKRILAEDFFPSWDISPLPQDAVSIQKRWGNLSDFPGQKAVEPG